MHEAGHGIRCASLTGSPRPCVLRSAPFTVAPSGTCQCPIIAARVSDAPGHRIAVRHRNAMPPVAQTARLTLVKIEQAPGWASPLVCTRRSAQQALFLGPAGVALRPG